ncbi:MAG: hypothetical protein ABI303_00155 [Candidatus Saccharimonas sp.]
MIEKNINIPNKNEAEAGNTTKRERRFGRAAFTLIAAGAAATFAFNTLASNGESQPSPEHFGGQLDPSITQIHIDEGATLRSAPFTDQIDNTTSVEKMDTSLDVKTADGVYVADNENGKWYGISVNDMKVDLESGVVTVWVNEQTATPEHE